MGFLRLAFLVSTCIAFSFVNCENFNVLKFGAKGDGQTDDSKAFVKAWTAACRADGNGNTLQIPIGKTFLLQPLLFQGPCKSPNIQIQLYGNIVAPSNKGSWSPCASNKWIGFSGVSGLSVVGFKSGTINGRGSSFWKEISKNKPHQIITPNEENLEKCDWPTVMHFHACDNLVIKGINSVDSPRNHISISSCNQVMISDINLVAPEDSPNTDGIDISTSSYVNIINSHIGTGDDCIAINSGCSNISIAGLNCGPGHGISVGSLGAKGSKDTVENVEVKYCTFNKTTNGARIKTWPGGQGYARNILYEHITILGARNPIIIDQYYGNDKHGNPGKEEISAVAISNVNFIDFHGTTSDEEAIKLECSKIRHCDGITVDNVKITTANGSPPKAVCQNVNGETRGVSEPIVTCLSKI